MCYIGGQFAPRPNSSLHANKEENKNQSPLNNVKMMPSLCSVKFPFQFLFKLPDKAQREFSYFDMQIVKEERQPTSQSKPPDSISFRHLHSYYARPGTSPNFELFLLRNNPKVSVSKEQLYILTHPLIRVKCSSLESDVKTNISVQREMRTHSAYKESWFQSNLAVL